MKRILGNIVLIIGSLTAAVFLAEELLRLTQQRYALVRVEFPDGYYMSDADFGARHSFNRPHAEFRFAGQAFETLQTRSGADNCAETTLLEWLIRRVGMSPSTVILLYTMNDLNDDYVYPSYRVVDGQRQHGARSNNVSFQANLMQFCSAATRKIVHEQTVDCQFAGQFNWNDVPTMMNPGTGVRSFQSANAPLGHIPASASARLIEQLRFLHWSN